MPQRDIIQRSITICAILLEGITRNNSEFGPVVQVMSFKDVPYHEVWWHFCSAEQNCFSNFGRGYHEEHSCESILNLDKWFRRRCHLKKKSTHDR